MRRGKSILIPALVYSAFLLLFLLLIYFYRGTEGAAFVLLVSGAILLVLAGITGFVIYVYFPLSHLRDQVKLISLDEPVSGSRGPKIFEFKELDEAMLQHLVRLKEVAHVANDLAEGKTENEFEAAGGQDEIGQAILRLKESIIHSKQEENNRRRLDEQQNWASNGLARFGELLRDFEQQKEESSNVFIRELVKYTGFEIGVLFLADKTTEGEQMLQLTGAYAFDREKQAHKTFGPGEGLAGRCAIEKQTILITDVPPDYIRIRSGLGENRPSAILLVPIIYDEDVLGVIELATFSEIEPYKVSFLESLARSSAPVLSKSITTGR
jgi:putative methionine-R-sulfoxide reductase with GAF domain